MWSLASIIHCIHPTPVVIIGQGGETHSLVLSLPQLFDHDTTQSHKPQEIKILVIDMASIVKVIGCRQTGQRKMATCQNVNVLYIQYGTWLDSRLVISNWYYIFL